MGQSCQAFGTMYHCTVIEALASFIKASGESKPDMQLEVLVDGVVKKQVSITVDNRFSFDGSLILEGDELVEVELSIESKNEYDYILIADPKPAGFEPVEVQSGWSYQGLAAFKEFRDEKVAFFVERLPRGRYNLSYRVKAKSPGKFSALPTKAEAMYAPELRGNAAEWKAVIGDH